MNRIEFGDCRDTMRKWKADGIKVQTCVTSPPYYGLRAYLPDTVKLADISEEDKKIVFSELTESNFYNKNDIPDHLSHYFVPAEIGLEQTPEEYIQNMVEVFRCVWDILEDNGTLWVNIGDSYYNYRPGKGQALVKQSSAKTNQDLPQECARRGNKLEGLKEKDLIGIPWLLAFALRNDGWTLRQDIIWSKAGGQPESVKDRCTKSHEYIFLLTKQPKYYYNHEAIKEPSIYFGKDKRSGKGNIRYDGKRTDENESGAQQSFVTINETKNKRSVWTVAPKPYSGAHFATFPPELIEPCILAGSKEGDIVLDPFMGSGTTASVAVLHNRQYLGCELNEAYNDLQIERIQSSVEVVETRNKNNNLFSDLFSEL